MKSHDHDHDYSSVTASAGLRVSDSESEQTGCKMTLFNDDCEDHLANRTQLVMDVTTGAWIIVSMLVTYKFKDALSTELHASIPPTQL